MLQIKFDCNRPAGLWNIHVWKHGRTPARVPSYKLTLWAFGSGELIKLFISLSSQSLNLGGRRGTTDDVATIPFHPSLSAAALVLDVSISSSGFLSLLFSLSPAELSSPCQRIVRCGHTICVSVSLSWLGDHPVAVWILWRTSSSVTKSL